MSDFNGELNKSLDDFMESYKITDTEKIYSNGMELVPIFRIKQWEEYNNQDKEIERLRLELSGYRQAILQDKEMLGLKKEIERLNNIIKEVREWVLEQQLGKRIEPIISTDELDEVLKILDKEKNENE